MNDFPCKTSSMKKRILRIKCPNVFFFLGMQVFPTVCLRVKHDDHWMIIDGMSEFWLSHSPSWIISRSRGKNKGKTVTRGNLFGLSAGRLIEDVLTDLDRLDVFPGPVWSYFPMVEIQSSTGSVMELPVEGLACDFLCSRVGFFLLCVIWTAIAPP